ncbi:MAG: helix-turn-helix transcriptional regulator [Christensenellales bacterium]
MDKKFCDSLKSIRIGCFLTQKQVAAKLHVVDSCYANWEQGRTEPNIAMLRKLAEIFNVSLDELINGD